MSRMPEKSIANYLVSKWKFLCFPVLALASSAPNSWAQAPAIVWDAQQVVGKSYNSPQSLAVSSNGTIFVADTGNNQIVALDSNLPQVGSNSVVATPGYVLTQPEAIALDPHGNLFVADTTAAGGRVIELFGDGNGNLTGLANPTPIVAPGTGLVNPIALTFDSAGTLFIGDLSANGAIYSLKAGTSTLQLLTFTGLPAQITPAGLLRDSSNNLYIADNGGNPKSSVGGIYKAPDDASGPAVPIATQQFSILGPSAFQLDAAGNLYVLTRLDNDAGPNAGQQVLVIPAASPATPYILPTSGINTGSDMAFDNNGNLDITDNFLNEVFQLSTPGPVNLGNVVPGTAPAQVQFNFEFNAVENLTGFSTLTGGDASSEFTQAAGGNCAFGNHTTGNGGQTISNFYPYKCTETYSGTPSFPGIRTGAVELIGKGGTKVLTSVPVFQTAYFGAQVVYPLTATIAEKGLEQPEAIAISGLNNKVYVADTQAGVVYSYDGLGSARRSRVRTGTITLSAPSALALDGAGNLYIADFNNAEVVEVPAANGVAPSIVNTGGLLQHPIAMALDNQGNLYIGDAGPGGNDAGTGNPGFLVKVPVRGAAFKMPNPAGISIVFPQALATDPYTGDLLVGDGGDTSSAGQVDRIFANGSGGTTAPIAGVSDPTGLVFDQADDLYILDGVAGTITAIAGPQLPNGQWLVQFDNSNLAVASALAISAGGQSFLIANIGTGNSNNLILLNGNLSTLNFGTQPVHSSTTLPSTVYNIGNLDLTLRGLASAGTNPAFSVSNSSTCSPGEVLTPSGSCVVEFVFDPQSLGFTSLNLTVLSDAYNGSGASNTPVLTLEGIGSGGAVHHHRRFTK